MPLAVRFEEYGDVDVLQVVDVPTPTPGPGEVLVKVVAAGINPGETAIRSGIAHAVFPAAFPSGQGSDLSGIIVELGADVAGYTPGDEVIGFTDRRASHAEYVNVRAEDLIPRPTAVSWNACGALYIAGTTAYAAVRSVAPSGGDTVVVSAAAGGVGSIAVQLAAGTGAKVIGLATPANHDWLRAHGAIPVAYGPGTLDRVRAASEGRVDAFLDLFGDGYVDLALELGVQPSRIDTIIDFAAIAKHGVRFEGNAAAGTASVLAELTALIAVGRLEIPIAAEYPLTEVRTAFRTLEQRHTHGKIVLRP